MNRIDIPAPDQVPATAVPLLEAVQKQLGVVPNLMKVISHSPAALKGYLDLNAALGKGVLGAQTGERIALAVAQINDCGYCLSAHTYIGKNLAKLADGEIAANRRGTSNDARAAAAVHFAAQVAKTRGHVADADVQAVKAAGYGDAELIEMVVHVALNTLTNYVNEVAGTTIDFPVVDRQQAA